MPPAAKNLSRRQFISTAAASALPSLDSPPAAQSDDPDHRPWYAIDCETTGVDPDHGSRPFFVSLCDSNGKQTFWEWDVDPLTREVRPPAADVRAIQLLVDQTRSWHAKGGEIAARHRLVGHNLKFDVTALSTIGVSDWPWAACDDTLIAAHLINSDDFHNLTDLATKYVGASILKYERALEVAVKAARTIVQQVRLREERWAKNRVGGAPVNPMSGWAISSDDRPDMPSGGGEGKAWRGDYWLPRAAAKFLQYAEPTEGCRHSWGADHHCTECGGHHWWTVLREYANPDTAITMLLFQRQWGILRERGLTRIYRERMRLPEVAMALERDGTTGSIGATDAITAEYLERSEEAGAVCRNIAAGRGYSLDLGTGGRTNSLDDFVFGPAGLKVNDKGKNVRDGSVRTADPRCLNFPPVDYTESGAPSLNKNALEHYELTLDANTAELLFVRKLRQKRSLDTALTYMTAYRRFWRELEIAPGYFVLHPSLNITGTAHLRWSSSSPNEQNISKKDNFNLRRCFGPAPGREWWSLDYSNIERRIPAYLAGETDILELLDFPDKPPYYGSEHLYVAHLLYPDKFEACCRLPDGSMDGRKFKDRYKSTLYQYTKNFNFALQYQCGREKGDATAHLVGAWDKVKQRFHRQEDLNRQCVAFANKHGYIETIPDRLVDPSRGYPIHIPRGENGRVKPTLPLSYTVSGTACWIAGRALVRVREFFERLNSGETFAGRKWPGRYFTTLYVHDELVIDAPSGRGKESDPWAYNLPVLDEVRRLMARGGEDLVKPVPTPVNLEYHDVSWARGVSV